MSPGGSAFGVWKNSQGLVRRPYQWKVEFSGKASLVDHGPVHGSVSGDGGLAIGAQLYNPAGVAVDGVARIFIADTVNNAIRLVIPRWLAPSRRADVP